MNEQPITDELLRRYLQGRCTPQERERVAHFLSQPEHSEHLHQIMEEETNLIWDMPATEQGGDDSRISGWQEKLQQKIQNEISESGAGRKLGKILYMGRKGMRYAAMFIGFVILIGTAWFMNQLGSKHENRFAQQQQQILPGSEKALLTLADGKTIALSDVAKGKIIGQDGGSVQKTADGEIEYKSDNNAIAANSYNTVVTPKGGQYHIILPDGSKVWLNAGSSLTYPVHFENNKRQVKMTGEVYFEIAKLKLKDGSGNVPFIVNTGSQQIQVLGTQFNVNAYSDEPYIRTVLVEGSVKLTALNNGSFVLLKPGEQAVFKNQFQVEPADIKQQLAWRNGDFIFQNETLESILRQISRWYDVEVDCPAHLSQLRLNAMISRSKPITTLIDIIETTHKNKVKLVLNGRRLTVKD